MTTKLKFGIVTPTYRRDNFLNIFLRRIRAQSYSSWDVVVVHDGKSDSARSLVDRYSSSDPRIRYLETPCRANDFGVTPRLFGMTNGLAGRDCDYVVLWDDDNLFYTNSLRVIARSLVEAACPELLLVRTYHRGGIF